MLNARKVPSTGGGNIEPIEPGTYPARLAWIISLGLQAQRPYMGEEKPPKYDLFLSYELLDEFMLDEDGNEDTDKPRFISETIPLNPMDNDRAKSTKRYLALDPSLSADGDWSQLVTTPVNVTIVQNAGKGANTGKVYNNISATSTMRQKDADSAGPLVNEALVFDFDDPNSEVYEKLPEFLKNKIKESLEYPGSKVEQMVMEIE